MARRRALILIAVALGPCLIRLQSSAEPRPAWPPWPEETLANYRFNDVEWHAPMLPPAIGFENALVQESWSEYALVRDGLSLTPVAVPAIDSTGRDTFAPGAGAVRFWFSPDWSSFNEGGTGPGSYARLLEMADLSGAKPGVRWSLYLGESGDELFFSGTGVSGQGSDFLSTKASFVAGEWQMITLAYSEQGSELWLGDQLVAEGGGVPAPAQWQEPSQALVLGSDLGVTAPAGGQFEELSTFDYWPDAQQQQFYHYGVSQQALRGVVGTPEEEAAKEQLVAMMYPQPVMMAAQSSSMRAAYSYSSNELWLEIVTVTNSQATFIIHTPSSAPYDLFSTTNLSTNVPGLNATNWVWEVRAPAGQTNITNSVGANPIAFYRLGTTNDTDSDGLTDAFENLVYHTDSSAEDTDGDALSDGEEVLEQGLNPLSMDSDGDGVIDQRFGIAITTPSGLSLVP